LLADAKVDQMMAASTATQRAIDPSHALRRLSILLTTLPYLVVILGFALRAWRVTALSVSTDEMDSLLFARLPLADLFAALAMREPHPPFYYLLLHGWVALSGQSELALRFPSVAGGALAVAGAYNAGRTLGGRSTGLATGVLLALSQFSVLHAQEARMYSLLQAWCALYLAALLHYLNRPRWRNAAFLIGFGLLAAYTHYDGLLLVALGAIPVVLSTGRWRAPRLLAPFVVMAVVYAPWVVFARQIFFVYRGWMGVVAPLEILRRSAIVYSVGLGVAGTAGQLALVVVPLLAVAGVLVLGSGRRWVHLITILCLGALPLLGVIAGSATGRALYNERYLIVITPAYLVVAGVGLAFVGRPFVVRPLALAVVVALAAVALPAYYSPSTPAYADARGTIGLILQDADRGAAVVLPHPQSSTLTYYLRDRLPTYVAPDFPSAEAVRTALDARLAGRDEVWFVRYLNDLGDEAIAGWLETSAFFASDQWVTTNHVLDYALPANAEIVEQPATERLADGTRITTLRRGPSDARPGGRVLVGFRWSPGSAGAAPSTTKVSLRLLDPWGQAVSTIDRRLVDPAELVQLAAPPIWQGALSVPKDAVPGPYHVEARFYDLTSNQTVAVSASTGTRSMLDLGVATVLPADPATLDPAAPLDPSAIRLTDSLFVEQFQLAGQPYSQHAHLVASFVWASRAEQRAPIVPELGLQNASGQIVASIRREEADQPDPLQRLRAGERVRERLDLPLRTVSASGNYRVVLRVGADRPWTALGTAAVAVDQKPVATASFGSPRSDLFAGSIRLVGVTLPTTAIPAGSGVSVSLGWHAEDRPEISYTVFVHLVRNAGEAPLAQSDSVPEDGKQPTNDWLPGDDVVDNHQIAVPAGLPPGQYRLIAGLYDATTGRRATVTGASTDGQTVDLGIVTVIAP
jgi:hypothetical protein